MNDFLLLPLSQAHIVGGLLGLVATVATVLSHLLTLREVRRKGGVPLLFDLFRFSTLGYGWMAISSLSFALAPRLFYDDYAHTTVLYLFIWLGWGLADVLFLLARLQEFNDTHPLQRRVRRLLGP